jgi:NTP pyrophosphatase (non-canonical NTP hydrolase)
MMNEFRTLRSANLARDKEWCGDVVLSESFLGNELAGEAGEVCNVIKKLERERLGLRGSRDTVEHLAEEIADTMICLDRIAMRYGIVISHAVRKKFNATSEANGLKTRLVVPQ